MAILRNYKDYSWYCDFCEREFRTSRKTLDKYGTYKPCAVKCPTCGREASVTVTDYGVQIQHGEHIFLCPRPLKDNFVMATIGLLGVFLTILSALAAVTLLVHPLMCPIVFVATLLTFFMFLLLQFANNGILSEKSLPQLMRIVIRTLPNFLGRTSPEGRTVPKDS